MNAKNLPLKFVLLAIVMAVCVWSIFWGNKIKQGIDLRGGHSLIFEIRTSELEREEIDQRLKELNAELAAATDSQKAQEIRQAITRTEAARKRLGSGQVDAGDLVERTVSILKQRVDPSGLFNTEWRPVAGNRFEVRMPAATEEARQAKQAYLEALAALEARNVRRSEIRRVLQVSGEQRTRAIEALVRKAPNLKDPLGILSEAHERMMRAKAAGQQEQYLNALADYESALRKVQEQNINLGELEQDLRAWHTAPQEQDASKADPDKAAKRRGIQDKIAALEKEAAGARDRGDSAAAGKAEKQLAALRDELEFTDLVRWRSRQGVSPDLWEQIKGVATRYRTWVNTRQFLDDPADLKRLIAKAGVLEFRIAPLLPSLGEGLRLPETDRRRYVEDLQAKGPDAGRKRNDPMLWFPVPGEREGYAGLVTADYAGQRYVLLYNQPGFVMLRETGTAGWRLNRAFPDTDQSNRLSVGFEFDEAGARRFGELTSAHVGNQMAILLDDEMYSAPRIQEAISKRGQITGNFTPEDVRDLVRTLDAGSLPARVNPDPVSESTFGPAIGQVNREMGIRSGYWGAMGVVAFMLIYYFLAGAVADVAMLLNTLLILGAMSLMNAVFTLPGIAGVILSIGMAVDANVLIYERLREEQAKGLPIRMALKNAYEKAFSAIFDSNVTTLITSLILGWVGTEEVRGFAITLGLGVVFNLLTAVVVTRWVFQAMLDGGIITRPMRMLRLIRVPNVDWMGKRYFFWAFSGFFVVMGVASLWWQRGNIWGIEFSAGTQAVVRFGDDAVLAGRLPDDGAVADLLRSATRRLGPDFAKLRDTLRVETRTNPDAVQQFLADHDLQPAGRPDGQITLAEWKAQKLGEEFFNLVDADRNGVLTAPELDKKLPAYSYQVAAAETDVSRVRRAVQEAFGESLQARTSSEFDLAKGRLSPEMGVELSPTGMTRITEELRTAASPPYADELEDYEGGVLLVVQNVRPPLSRADLAQRIREMRLQPDFAKQLLRPTEVLGLTPAGEEGFSSLAVLVSPAEAGAVSRPGAWEKFAEEERVLLAEACRRQEALVATNFDAAIAGRTSQLAIVALVLSWLAIIAYLWLRFGSWRWGLAAVICLIHDTLIVVGLVAASGWLCHTAVGRVLGIDSFKIDLTMVAAVLTIIGYSVNDTIVVFDRIRENRGKLATVSLPIINASINQTLSRTLLTGLTTILVLITMYVAGGPGIHAFSYALLAGLLFGTYSSIAIASPLLMGFRGALVARSAGAAVQQIPG